MSYPRISRQGWLSVLLLCFISGFYAKSFAQCLTINSVGSNTITACQGSTVTLSPTINFGSPTTLSVSYSWGATGGVVCTPANTPYTTITMPLTNEVVTFSVTATYDLITNGHFDAGVSGWTWGANYGYGCGPHHVQIATVSTDCSHFDCTPFSSFPGGATGNMLSVDGDEDGIGNFLQQSLNGCGNGTYSFACQVRPIAKNRRILRWSEVPDLRIKIGPRTVPVPTLPPGCPSSWTAITDNATYTLNPGDLITFRDATAVGSLHNEFAIDAIKLTYTVTKTFTYYLKPTQRPVINNVVAPGHVCCGTSFSLTAETSGGTPPYVYLWDGVTTTTTATRDGFKINCNDQCNRVVNTTVAVTDANGCRSTNYPLTITSDRPAEAGSIVSVPACHDLCPGDICKVGDIHGACGSWISSPAAVISLSSVLGGVNINALSAGTATVSYVVPPNACGAGDTATYGVTVHPVASATATTTTPIVCIGSPIIIRVTGTPGTFTYTSTFSPGVSSSAWDVIPSSPGYVDITIPTTGASEGTYTFDLLSITNGYCPGRPSSRVTVVIKQPTASIISSTKVCTGQPFTLTVQGPSGPDWLHTGTVLIQPVSPTASGAAFVVIPPSSSTVATTTTVITPPAGDPGPYYYHVTEVSGYGCTHIPVAGATFTVTPIPYPEISITAPFAVCEGDPISISIACSAICPSSVALRHIPWGTGIAQWRTLPYNPSTSSYLHSDLVAGPTDGGTYVVWAVNDICVASVHTDVTYNRKPSATVYMDQTCDWESGTELHFNGSPNSTIYYVSGTGEEASVTTNYLGVATAHVSSIFGLTYTITKVVDNITGCTNIIGPWTPVWNASPYWPETTPVYLSGSEWEIFCPGYTSGHCLIATCVYRHVEYGLGVDLIIGVPFTCTVSSVHTPLSFPSGSGINLIEIMSITDCVTGCLAGTQRSVAVPYYMRPAIVARSLRCSSTSTSGSETFAAIRATGAPVPTAYQWYKSTGGAPFSPMALATDSTFTYSPSDTDRLYFTVTDTSGTDTSDIYTVHIYPYPSVYASVDSVTVCAGDSLFFGLITPEGGNNYIWTGSGISCLDAECHTAYAHPLLSGNYTVTATNSGGCTAADVVHVNVLPSPPLSVVSDNVEICAGQPVNMHVVYPSDGTSYTWSDGVTCTSVRCDSVVDTPSVTTTYTVTAVTGSGCIQTATITVVVHAPSVAISSDATTLCGSGTANLSVSSPAPDLYYSWSGGYTACSNSLCSSVTAIVTGTTTYTVTATDDFGCSTTATQSIAVYSVPSVTANASSTVVCGGNTVTLSVADYDPALSYAWSGGSVSCLTSSCNIATDNPFSTTIYTVTATNAYGCSAVSSVGVYMTLPVSATVASATVCPGSTLSLSVSDPIPGVTYTWSGGDIACATADCSVATAQPVAATIYTLTASADYAEGCTTIAAIPVGLYSVAPVFIGTTTPVCGGDAVTLTVLSPVAGTSYSWSGGSVTCNTGDCLSAVDHPAGTTVYTLSGIDAHGCTSTSTHAVEMLVPVSASASSSAICAGQTITLYVNDPVSGYTYSWAGFGESDSVTDNSGDTLLHVRVFNSGTYTLTATNGGCSAATVVSVNVNQIQVNPDIYSTAICSGSEVTMNVLSPNATYTYSWYGGAVACSGSDCYTAIDHPVVNTTYWVVATDTIGCTDTAQITVQMNVPLTVSLLNDHVCAGQTATAYIDDANSSFSYWWGPSSGSYMCMTSICDTIRISSDTTTLYTVIATDTLGCTQTDTFTLHIMPLPSVVAGVASTLVCDGALVTINVLSPISSNSYHWTDATCVDASCYSATTVVSGFTSVVVTATDANGCSNSATIEMDNYPLPSYPAAVQDIVCSGMPDIVYVPSPSGTYTWHSNSPFTCLNASCDSITVTPSDTGFYYYVTVDSNGCSDSLGVIIPTYPLPIITASSSTTICGGSSATLTASGGNSYSWMPGASSANPFVVSPMATTTYTVTGTNTNGCSSTASVTVNVPSLSIAGNNVICQGSATTLTASGAVTYSWAPSAGLSSTTKAAPSVSPTVTTTYTVTGVTSMGCVITNTVTVTVNTTASYSVAVAETAPFYLYDPQVNAYTYCGSARPLELWASSGIPSASYVWTPSVTSYGAGNQYAAPTPTVTTTYTVSATYGCTYKAVLKVAVPVSGCSPCDNFTVSTFNSSASGSGTSSVQPFHTILGGTITTVTGSGSTPATNNLYVGSTTSLSSGTYSNKIMYMSKDVNLLVGSSSNVVLNACHLFGSCGWRGVRVAPGATDGIVSVIGNSLLEDQATNSGDGGLNGAVYVYSSSGSAMALPSSGPIIKANNAIFNKNVKGISLGRYNTASAPANYPFEITNSIFTNREFGTYNDGIATDYTHCYPFSWPSHDELTHKVSTSDPYDPGYDNLLLYPVASGSSEGVYMTACVATGATTYSNVVVGSTTTTSGNLFDNLTRGIHCQRTSLAAYNNVFNGISDKAIYFETPNDNSMQFQALIGGAEGNGNIFYNSPYAYYSYAGGSFGAGVYYLMFKHNRILSSLSATTYGVSVNTASFSEVNVSYNYTDGVKNPIYFVMGYDYITSWSHGDININSNEVHNSFGDKAISIAENPIGTSGTYELGHISINHNSLMDVYNGIYLLNVKYMPFKVNMNSVKVALSSSGNQFGIRILRDNALLSVPGTNDAEVVSNKIVGPGYDLPTSTSGDGGGISNGARVEGITLWSSGDIDHPITVAKNYVYELKQGFRFEQTCYAQWRKNVMENNRFGLVLATNSTGPSVKGTMGNQGSNCNPSDNQWLEDPSTSFHWTGSNYQTFVSTLNPGTTTPTSLLFVRNTAECKPTNNGGGGAWSTPVPYALGTSIFTTCPDCEDSCTTPTREDPNADGSHGWKPIGNSSVVAARHITYEVYPNPATGKIFISRQGRSDEKAQLKIYNTLGSVVYEQVLEFDSEVAEIPALNVASGIYIVEIIGSDSQRFTTRLVVQN
jgi:hypothetical protein